MSTDKNYYDVLVPYPVDKAYTYAFMHKVEVGEYVLVPLGSREVIGVVWGKAAAPEKPEKIKPVSYVFDTAPPMQDDHMRFIEPVAKYTLAPLGSVLKMALSAPRALDPPAPVKGYRVNPDMPQSLSPKQQRLYGYMAERGEAMRAADITRACGASAAVIKGLLNNDGLVEVMLESEAICADPNLSHASVDLNDEQSAAAEALVNTSGFKVFLLDGVTGSGKTEVYFEAVTKALESGKQVLVMLPEIALTTTFLDRFEARYGCKPALWHSGMTPAQRTKIWRGVAKGETKVVIGARSALFLPYADLGLIVVDEEHDPSYKQEQGVIYNARDMAVLRAALGKFSCILASATPSMESLHNAHMGKYAHLRLTSRYGLAEMPTVSVIDMREEREDAKHFLSQTLKDAIAKAMRAGEQSLLFLNRRGYAPLTLCQSCGHRYECDRCSAWLTEHKSHRNLQCHHCGYTVRKPNACPSCDEADSLVACGPGVERIFDEVVEAFPDARAMVLSSDTAEDGTELSDMLHKIHAQKVDIIIGTQIVAKGHHFPKLTCVGVVDADLGLSGGDLRATERTWQLLHQVSGRAGRGEDPGYVYLQTFFPDNKVMQALVRGERDMLVEMELAEREMAFMPPYSRLCALIISGAKEAEVQHFGRELARCAPQGEKIKTLGPAPAPILRLRNKYRYRMLVIADKGIDLQKAVSDWTSQVKLPSKMRLHIDIDPMSFM